MRPQDLTRFFQIAVVLPLISMGCDSGFTGIKSNSPAALENPAPGHSSQTVTHVISTSPLQQLSQSSLSGMTSGDGVALANFWQYSPQYPLYSHGSSKRRWVYLPVSQKINNADADAWEFPAGTVFWKEFALDGKKIETRVLEKVSAGRGLSSWRATVYLWRADQSEADLLVGDDFYERPANEANIYQAGLVRERYQIVAPSQCIRCHSSAADAILGFNYLQLSEQSLKRNVLELSESGWLEKKVQELDTIPGNEQQKNAIGYLQSNCIMCHAGQGPGPHNFKHLSSYKSSEDEAVIRSIAASPGLITPRDPAMSRLYLRFSAGTMPPATITIDPTGQDILRQWIEGL